jgi:DNA-binding beta-propeller fold protein YncE
MLLPVRFFLFFSILVLTPALHAEKVVLMAGGGIEATGVATNCRLQAPFGLDFDQHGNLYIAEMAEGERVLRVDAEGRLSVFAGTGEKGDRGDGGAAAEAQFNGMHNLVVGPENDLFIADTWNNRVRKIDQRMRTVVAFAGTGKKGFGGDGGPATVAEFGGVYCVALDPNRENLYVADLDNRRVRAINLKSGIVTTVAGNGQKGVPSDGMDATQAPLVDPRAIALDSSGNLYILERSGHALRVVDRRSRIRTVVGTGSKGFSGDGGAANMAALNGPKHLCVDREGNLIIADTENHAIRKYLSRDQKIVRIAGTGMPGTAGIGGPASALQLNQPHGVCVDTAGNLYIADSSNNRVLKIEF